MKKRLSFKRIRTKLLLSFGVIIILTSLISLLSYIMTEDINEDTKEIMKEELPLLIMEKNLATNMYKSSALVEGYMIYNDQNSKSQLYQTLDEMKETAENISSINESAELKELMKKLAIWESTIATALEELDSGNESRAVQTLSSVKSLMIEIEDGFDLLALEREDHMVEHGESMVKQGTTTSRINIIIAAVVTVFGLIIAFLTSVSITKPVTKVMQRMNALADGDLSHEPLETKARDEIAQLVTATNMMNKNNRDLLEQVYEVSETVSSQSEELTQAANEVKSGTEQVASTMEELASGAETQANSASHLASIMGILADSVKTANENGTYIQENSGKVLNLTAEGNQLMQSSAEQMQRIEQIVKDAVEKMGGLDEQSKEISKLVSVIKDVAEQTNLLALNAAIEAARAGEHGKGFAVVADEVRKLAEQVAISVNDITSIVTNIQNETGAVSGSLREGYNEVEAGTTQIESTRDTFNDIQTAVRDEGARINEMSQNLSEIVANSENMNESIENIASISEESAAGVEETAASAQQSSSSMEEVAASSQQLAQLAEQLNTLVGRFKL
ncbi:methyl-accepting chemotaxis protein [Lentibacillus saliphilus]|uniref:methyl-accepting chemotaxis protein n=1 Tax=Lentibacillus saliphilus TaxID=2737028 RepID=UPI001C2F3C84|nr:methyl-accepting chemotaxis protein [Lentibacillus saliphilus]